MQAQMRDFDDEDEEVELGDYEEGLDDDYDEDEDEEYDEELDLLGDEEAEDEGDGRQPEYIRGLGPLAGPGPGQGGQQQSSRQAESDTSKPWQGLDRLPAATKTKYLDFLRQLQGIQKQQITILLLGKYLVGKSFTTNSLLNEEAAKRQFMNREASPPIAHTREAHGFTLSIIDTGGVTEVDLLSTARLKAIGNYIKTRPIDVVVYMDRFDMFRTDGNDQQVIEGISSFFGRDIWKNTVIGLTHAGTAVNDMTWDEFAAKRGQQLQQAIRKHGECKDASLPVAFLENSDKCKQNETGEKVLQNGEAWLPKLMDKVTNIALTEEPYTYDEQSISKKYNPNKKLRWLIPVVFAAQVAFKVFVFDRLVDDDSIVGDKNGPFDPAVQARLRRIRNLERSGTSGRDRRRRA